MKSITIDKIASVTRNCPLSREVKLADEYPCREGDLIAVRVLTNKSAYNQLELVSGRLCQLSAGDVIVGALGHRNALLGYAGHCPETLKTGDTIDILNTGGVLGHCDSVNPDVQAPFSCEVLGQVLSFPYLGERVGVPARIDAEAPPLIDHCDSAGVPVVAVLGTCMNSGKTAACNVLIHEFTRQGLIVHGAKATGVSLRRDALTMEDAGAARTLTFTDLGVVTTSRSTAAAVTRTLITHLASQKPDLILVELGDGLLGEYGVDAILECPQVRSAVTAFVFAAADPVGTWGGVRRLAEQHGVEVAAITGPVTDNSAGTDFVARELGIPAANARTAPQELAKIVMAAIQPQSAQSTQTTQGNDLPQETPEHGSEDACQQPAATAPSTAS